jgi:hypothetical protein
MELEAAVVTSANEGTTTVALARICDAAGGGALRAHHAVQDAVTVTGIARLVAENNDLRFLQ